VLKLDNAAVLQEDNDVIASLSYTTYLTQLFNKLAV